MALIIESRTNKHQGAYNKIKSYNKSSIKTIFEKTQFMTNNSDASHKLKINNNAISKVLNILKNRYHKKLMKRYQWRQK